MFVQKKPSTKTTHFFDDLMSSNFIFYYLIESKSWRIYSLEMRLLDKLYEVNLSIVSIIYRVLFVSKWHVYSEHTPPEQQ